MSFHTIPITRIRTALLRTLLLLFTATPALDAQQPNDPSMLSLQRIFASREFAAKSFGESRWLDDSTYTTVEQAAGDAGNELVRYDATTGRRAVLVGADVLKAQGEATAIELESYEWSVDRTRLLVFTNSARVWRANTRGDFWVLDVASRRLRKLGGPDAKASTLQFAKFSPDGRRVAYVREHDIYVESLDDGRITRLTHDGSKTTINGTFDWVYEEELFLRDGFRWSDDGTKIAYWQLDATGVRDFLLINNTDSLYSYTIPVQFPKAGTTNSSSRVGVVNASGGATTWCNVPGDLRQNYIARMDWAPGSREITIQQLNRRQTVNTLYFCESATGRTRAALVERDSAWIDIYDDHVNWGPGPSLHWTPNGTSFVWVSERDGWRHAYLVARDGGMRLITKGPYDVMKVARIDTRGGWLYFYASPENATQMFLWRIRLNGTGAPQRLTPGDARGNHDYDIGPGAKFAIHTTSSWGTPPAASLVRLPAHTVTRTLVVNDTLAARLAILRKGEFEFFQTDIGEGIKLNSYLMKPANFDPAKKYPVLFHVYGEPWDQTVRDSYGGSQWLWHLMLTQQGYIVASVDNRGTPGPRGREWRKVIRNQIGALRVRENSAAARVFGRRSYVDSTRIGVWGWSGGGSTTLHLMFRAPDVYRMGMSVAPVPDVRNYDTIYQERYVGLPSTDSAAYHDASPIHYVAGLRGNLLVVHGTGDDNVHYQGTEQLVNALVAANKPFTMMSYPNRSHGIFEGRGTRLHLYSLLTRYTHENLPAGGVLPTVQ
ncbi:MAG: S9 family peptidase [Steroidobacteraceae bacterium]|nr:S9 family peptidase [Steroidobacteraceae bacterium]